ncbi:MAG: hypothetical protein IPK21_18705 [Haliscomenobacter sp.]|nr:hypothetical protein [Haliscomenobacter sp.]
MDDNQYAIRDLSKGERNLPGFFSVANTFAGWLCRDENETYHLIDCDIPGRISHIEIDNYFNTNFAGFFGENGDFDNTNNQQKSAKFKYELFANIGRELNFEFIKQNSAGAKIYAIDDGGQEEDVSLYRTAG